jgi:peptidoglycan-N-acetylglucosamine deacetylase
MDDGFTALRDRPGSGPHAPVAVRRRAQPHHLRRRALAGLVVVALAALIAGLAAGAGGGSATHRTAGAATGFFGRIQTLAGDDVGSLAYDERAAENAAVTRTLAFTPYIRVAGAQHREIALTFDDGPGPFTPQVLAILERAAVPATFFEVGVLEKYFHASTAQIVADGDAIGDHTQSHAPMSKLSPRDQQAQLLQQIAATGAYDAPFPRLFRPPYGLWNSNTLSLLRRYKMLMVLWTVDTSDYRRPGVSAIVRAAVSGARPGAIILLHDAGGDRAQTIAALPRIISTLRARGYRFVTVPRLLVDNPAPADQRFPATLLGAGG